MRRSTALFVALAAFAVPSSALAVGESVSGFPNWSERVMHEWANRARVDPQLEMTKCGAACGEATCFQPIAPLSYAPLLNHSARFHSAHMGKNNYFQHDSKCALLPDVPMTYPGSCDGSATCSCMGGTLTGSTAWNVRIGLFGASASAEIIASSSDPDQSFYLWLFENSPSTACQYSSSNGHRWSLLTSTSGIGFGTDGPAVGDFGSGAEPAYPIPSGAHYPRQGATVDMWANWSDAAAPSQALVNVDGTCLPMTHARGSMTNGAWTLSVPGNAGCARYYFLFKDAGGADVTYPSTGSLGVGDATCAEWSSARPAAGAGCGTGGTGAGGGSGTGGSGVGATGGSGAGATGGSNAGKAGASGVGGSGAGKGGAGGATGGKGGASGGAAGTSGAGGVKASGGGAVAAAGSAGDTGASDAAPAGDSGGCGCGVPRGDGGAGVSIGLLFVAIAARRRRRVGRN